MSLTIGISEVNQIRMPKDIRWEPKEDITAYELARATTILVARVGGADPLAVEDHLMSMPDEVRRHFKIMG